MQDLTKSFMMEHARRVLGVYRHAKAGMSGLMVHGTRRVSPTPFIEKAFPPA